MSQSIFDDEYDLSRIIVKPLYFGLTINVLVPAALLMVAYYLDQKLVWTNRIGETADILFYVLAALALAEGVIALWLRKSLFSRPMIRRMETFEQDFAEQYHKRCKVLFAVIAAIPIYGFIYFYLTGRFKEMVLFVVLAFVIFQLVRPRIGLTRKLVAAQKALIDKGVSLDGP